MRKNIIVPKEVYTTRLVKSEDLNHHGTLFAGRTAEWFVESGFFAAASIVNPKCILCLKIHGMCFTKSVASGQILKFTSKVVYAGKSSMVTYIQVSKDANEEPFVSGFITFIYVDEETNPKAHNIEILPKTDIDIALFKKAKGLKIDYENNT